MATVSPFLDIVGFPALLEVDAKSLRNFECRSEGLLTQSSTALCLVLHQVTAISRNTS